MDGVEDVWKGRVPLKSVGDTRVVAVARSVRADQWVASVTVASGWAAWMAC